MGGTDVEGHTSYTSASGILQRDRLFHLLDEGRERLVVWVSGPGGAGKTTLVNSYLESRALCSFWYQLVPGDAEPATFFYNLGQAAKQAFPRKKVLPALSVEYLSDVSVFAKRFFSQFFTYLTTPAVIVLDDFQHLSAAPQLHELLKVGVAVLPPGISFLIVGRDEPPTQFARLAANDEMSSINWRDLSFTVDESRGLIRIRGGADLPDHLAQQLHEKSEGWAVGLVVLIEHLRRQKGGADYLDGFAPERIFDYFASEVFEQLDEDTQRFLLRTAFLPRMNVGIVQQLTTSPHARSILAGLSRNNYFTTLHHGPAITYQYHQLFRDFLLCRAIEILPPSEVTEIRKRAADLLARSGSIEEAGEIFVDLGDWDALACLAKEHAPVLLAQGRNQLLEEWLTCCPEEMRGRDPWLPFWLGCACTTRGYALARGYLEEAFPLFDQAGDAAGSYLAWAGIVDTIVSEWADFQRLDLWIEHLDRLQEKYPQFPSRDIEGRVSGSILGALMFHLPQHPQIEVWADRIFTIVKECTDPATRILTGHTLALYHTWWSGNHTKLGMLMDLLRPPGKGSALPPLPRVIWITLKGLQEWILGQTPLAQKSFHDGIAASKESGVHIYDFMLYFLGIVSYLDEGDFRTGGEYIEELFAQLDRSQHMNLAHCHYVAAWQSVLEGDVARAREHVLSGLDTAKKIGGPFTLASVWAAWTQVQYLSGNWEEARAANEQGIRMAKENKCDLLIFRNLMVKAYFAFESDDQENGLQALREGMGLASRMSFMNYSWWHRAIMSRLCLKALEAGIETEFVTSLIKRRNLFPDNPPVWCREWPWQVRVYTLGRFMVEIGGKILHFEGKAQKKPLEVLKVLIGLGGAERTEGEVADILWPEADADTARNALKITLHRLRRILGSDTSIQVRQGLLCLDQSSVWSDAAAFVHLCDEAVRQETGGKLKAAIRCAERAIQLYQGDFLPGEIQPLALAVRERLRMALVKNCSLLGATLEKEGEELKAAGVYEQGLNADVLSEELYRRLIQNYSRRGLNGEALSTFRRCCSVFKSHGTKPSPATRQLTADFLQME